VVSYANAARADCTDEQLNNYGGNPIAQLSNCVVEGCHQFGAPKISSSLTSGLSVSEDW